MADKSSDVRFGGGIGIGLTRNAKGEILGNPSDWQIKRMEIQGRLAATKTQEEFEIVNAEYYQFLADNPNPDVNWS